VNTELTRWVARLLLAPVLIIAAAILVKGYADTGDGFSAGVIASLGILLQDAAFGREPGPGDRDARRALRVGLAGMALALVVAFAPVLAGGEILEHAPAPGAKVIHLGTLELITAVAFDVGVCLLVVGAVVGIIRLIADVHAPGAQR
jgi:multisubunit Na+/H+ antiporter MnhB subunit